MKGAAALAILTLFGCGSIPPLSASGAAVRIITADQARTCALLQPVQFVEHVDAVGRNPTVWRTIAEAQMRNRAAAAGGNALVITSDDASWFWGDFYYKGEAYRCTG